MLPGIDGIEVCRRIREQDEVPVLMLTARDATADRVLGLEAGHAVVDEQPQFAFDQAERRAPDADDVVLADHRGGHLAAVHEGAVVTAQVDDLVGSGG